jgi:peptide/nickel transport system ATP-binding protein
LSGGMRQRAMIAMAISCHPALLLADEPTTALDVTVQAQILALLLRLKEEYGMAMMYITHNLAVVAEISDDVAVMYLGRVMEYCNVHEITANPLHPYTRALNASIPRIDGEIQKLEPIRGTLPSSYSIPKGCVFHTRCKSAIPGVCDQNPAPVYREVSPGHWVNCHLYDEGR